MSCKVKELYLNGILYNTAIEEDRRIIGKHYEQKLLNYLIDNNINVEYTSQDNKYCSHDFIISFNNINYIVELKSRLNDINMNTYELICSNKIKAFKKRINKDKNIKILFVFNHITTEDDYNFYYYIVDIDGIEKDAFLNYDCYKYPTYELPIKHVRPLDQLFKN
jgi:hypothetical protein